MVGKWNHLQHLKIAKILGSEKQRVQAINQPADLYLINRENVEYVQQIRVLGR